MNFHRYFLEIFQYLWIEIADSRKGKRKAIHQERAEVVGSKSRRLRIFSD